MSLEKKIILIGSGQHARTLLDNISFMQCVDVLGYLDVKENSEIALKHLGDDDDLKNYSRQDVVLVNGIGAVELPVLRSSVYQKFKSMGYKFITVVHPFSSIAPSAKISDGVQVMAGSVISSGAIVEENVIINTSSSIDHDCVISRNVHVAPGVVMSGEVSIGESSFVGLGTKIKQGVRIGKNVLIGAGSLVLFDIPDNSSVYGSPAKFIED